jgi:hypothetical protein
MSKRTLTLAAATLLGACGTPTGPTVSRELAPAFSADIAGAALTPEVAPPKPIPILPTPCTTLGFLEHASAVAVAKLCGKK